MTTVPLRLCVRRPVGTQSAGWGGTAGRVRMTVDLPTELSVVEQAVDLVARHCIACGLPGRQTRFNLQVALGEALANAMLYGNRMDPAKQVRVALRLIDRGIQVQVEDEGEGFDPACIPDPTNPECVALPAGRGLFLIRELVDEIAFNDQGNAICMTLRYA